MKKIKKILSNPVSSMALALGFTVLVLYIVFKDNYKQILELLSTIQPIWFVILLLVVIFYHYLIGINLKILVNASGCKYTWWDGLLNAVIATFWHGVTPSASGGQVGQLFVFKKQRVPSSNAAGVLWADFVVYQVSMVVTVATLLLLRFSYFRIHFSNLFLLVILGFIVNSFIVVVLLVGVKHERLYHCITNGTVNLLVKIRIIKNKNDTMRNLNYQLMNFKQCADSFTHNKKVLLQCAGLQVARLLVYYAIPFLVVLSMNIRPLEPTSNAMMLLDCICLTAYVSMVNAFIPIPGASGGTEAIFVLMFSTIYGAVQASAMMALWRFYTYYLLMVIGAVTFLLFKNFYHARD